MSLAVLYLYKLRTQEICFGGLFYDLLIRNYDPVV